MADSAQDQRWMRRALRLASLSLGMTWPNPGVGCVLVRGDREIGAGRHRVCGQLHAETAALADAQRRGNDPAGATAYVTLAPCTRHGRQPPCVDALVRARIARVVVAIADPDQDTAGGILNAAGIAYQSGLLEDDARHLHGGFLCRVMRSRPRFTGKWAASLDGCIAAGDGRQVWISSEEALASSRRRRRAFDAILVGGGTARADDPSLLAIRPRQHGDQSGLLRIVITGTAELAPHSRLVATLDRAPLLILHGPQATPARIEELTSQGVSLLALPDPHDPHAVAAALGRWGLNDVLVEGGAEIHAAFLRAGLYDRLELYQGAITLGGGLPIANSPGIATGPGAAAINDGGTWQPEASPRFLGSTLLTRWRRQR